MRPFALRRRGPVLRPVPATGSTFPAYIFDAILKRASTRSASSSRSRLAFYLPRGIRSTLEARCRGLKPVARSTSGLPACFRAATPLQDISILRDQSAQPDTMQECLPLRVVRSSFAPRLAKMFNDRRAMDQRSRSATSRQAHCSSNLLEPSSSCTRGAHWVNMKMTFPTGNISF